MNDTKKQDRKRDRKHDQKQDQQRDREQDQERDQKRQEIKSEIFSSVRIFIIALICAFILNSQVIVNARVPSGSMENTIQIGDRLIANRLAYNKKDPERYDIILFKYPDDETNIYVKRVIGLPGEKIVITDGKVYVNDNPEALDDSFIPEKMTGSYGPFEVPEGCYFVMGDNRNYSWDSRFWNNTYVAKDKILGKAVFRYWPLTEMGSLESDQR